MVELTVAMPMYKAGNIADLCLEGLCRQRFIDFKWELIVAEESSKDNTAYFGETRLRAYEERLREVGCIRIIYIDMKEWVPLSHKWILIKDESDVHSEAFLLQAADTYPHRTRLFESHKWIVQEEYDWYQQRFGYFYDVPTGKIALFDYENKLYFHPCALNMAIRTDLLDNLMEENVEKGVDSWIFNRTKPEKVFLDENFYADSLDINGHNVISVNRTKMITTPTAPYSDTDATLESILDDSDLIEMLENSKDKIKPNNMKQLTPSITIGVINNGDEKQFKNCLISASSAFYSGQKTIKFIDKGEKTYGECFNILAEASNTDWIMVMEDYHEITKEYLMTMIYALESSIDSGNIDNYCVISNISRINRELKHMQQKELPSPGMWYRDFVLAYPVFVEKAEDMENYMQDVQNMKEPDVEILYAQWQYGYFVTTREKIYD